MNYGVKIMYEMTETQLKEFDDATKQIAEEENARYEKDKKILDNIKNKVHVDVFESIKYEIKESENASNFKIVDSPIGEYQRTNEDNVKVWVDQYSVGDTGDSWAGIVSVELPNGKYLMWDYWM